MDFWGPMIGVFTTGLIVGWISMFFIRRLEKYTIKGLALIFSAFFGGALIQWLSRGEALWWIYPVGILAGIVSFIVIALAFGAKPDGTVYGKLPFKNEKGDH